MKRKMNFWTFFLKNNLQIELNTVLFSFDALYEIGLAALMFTALLYVDKFSNEHQILGLKFLLNHFLSPTENKK